MLIDNKIDRLEVDVDMTSLRAVSACTKTKFQTIGEEGVVMKIPKVVIFKL
jgi:hypothetical protein